MWAQPLSLLARRKSPFWFWRLPLFWGKPLVNELRLFCPVVMSFRSPNYQADSPILLLNLYPRPPSGQLAKPLSHLPVASWCSLWGPGCSAAPCCRNGSFLSEVSRVQSPQEFRTGVTAWGWYLAVCVCSVNESRLHGFHFSSLYTRIPGRKQKLGFFDTWWNCCFPLPQIPWPASETPSHPPPCQVNQTICVSDCHNVTPHNFILIFVWLS